MGKRRGALGIIVINFGGGLQPPSYTPLIHACMKLMRLRPIRIVRMEDRKLHGDMHAGIDLFHLPSFRLSLPPLIKLKDKDKIIKEQ